MKKALVIISGVILILAIALSLQPEKLIGKTIEEQYGGPEEEHHGIPPEEQKCMQKCVAIGCEPGDRACMISNGDKCMGQCNAGPPETQSKEELCMQDCVDKSCTPGPEYASCMDMHLKECEEECGMIKEPEAQNEEEQCIRDCVAKVDPSIICGSSKDGETGNEVCQRCAQECVHLYGGPCLSDEEIAEKENYCSSQCEYCYGEPVMGPSGEGWDCIVDIKCADASSEWGDEPGEGPEISETGRIEKTSTITEEISGAVGNVFEAIGNFISNIFGRDAE
ncbi:MAG: hypothetical protein ABIB71_04155 [Candidatus Woesearchaeota archaeon]